jgi:hypothetical protein
MIRISFFLVFLFSFMAVSVNGQDKLSALEAEFLKQVNLARTDPQKFVTANLDYLKANCPAFLNKLNKAKPVSPMVINFELCKGADKMLDGNQNPPEFANLCGMSAGLNYGVTENLIPIMNSFYHNILNPDEKIVGFKIKNVKPYGLAIGIVFTRNCDEKITKYDYVFKGKIDTSAVDFKKLNTAANASYLSAAEKMMIREINFARAYPKIYADIVALYLEEQSKAWSGLSYMLNDAGLELIDELKNLSPLSILTPMQCIYNAAKKHGLDEKNRGYSGHTGSDKSDPWDRILKECPSLKTGNENLCGGYPTPRKAVIGLLIDSGISTRGHRHNTLDPEWKYVACYFVGDIGKMPNSWVQNYGK